MLNYGLDGVGPGIKTIEELWCLTGSGIGTTGIVTSGNEITNGTGSTGVWNIKTILRYR